MPHVIEGTPQELGPYLAQRPNGKFRLVELEEADAPELSAPVLSEKSKAAIALFDIWLAEGLAADEETRCEANKEVEEFKRNMNANRAATGERLIYP